MLSSVLIVMATTQHIVRDAHNTGRDCNIFQSNIQSANTSIALLDKVVQARHIDVVCLQETWHSEDNMRLRNFQNPPLVNKREVGDTGGGVAILCHERMRCKHLDEYNVNGLEAI